MNLEDRMEEKHLIDFSVAVERVRSARRAADATGVRLVLNARTDAFEAPEIPREKRLAEAVRRDEVEYVVGLPGEGHETEVFFSDLSCDYVSINAEYST